MYRIFSFAILLVTLSSLVHGSYAQEKGKKDLKSKLGSGSRDLLPAVELKPRKASATTYIIFYANETDSESVGRLAAWLDESGADGHGEAAIRLREDAEKFPQVVADEISNLMRGAAADPNLGLIVFTNALANRGVFQFMDCDDKESILVKWPVVSSKLKVFQSHPLAHPNSIELALAATAKKLSEPKIKKSDFVLITKSHGSTKLALAQSFAPMHQANSKTEFLKIIADVKAAAEKSKASGKMVKSAHQIRFDQGLMSETPVKLGWSNQLGTGNADDQSNANKNLGINQESNLGLGKDSNLGVNQNSNLGTGKSIEENALNAFDGLGTEDGKTLTYMGNDTLGVIHDSNLGVSGGVSENTLGIGQNGNLGIDNPNAAKFFVSGTTKQQLLQAVLNAGKFGMYFDTLFLESCQSELTQPSLARIRKLKDVNIGRLYFSSATGLRYRTINYPSLFGSGKSACCGGKEIRFTERLTNGLDQIAQLHLREGMPSENAGQGFAVIAHRGASGYLPEHTSESYALAYGMGADYIEQDVVLTKDNHPIVLHDIHLDTVTNVAQLFPNRKRDDGRFYAIDLTLDEIKTLSVHERVDHKTGKSVFADRFPQRKSSFRVPTLAEAIELVQGLNRSTGRNVGIYPEIKKPKWHRDQGKDISGIVLELLKKQGYQDKSHNVYLQCFDPVELRRIREELKCELKLVQLIGSNDWNEAKVDYNQLVTQEGLKKIAEYADGVGPWLNYIIEGRSEKGRLKRSKLVAMAHDNDLIVHPFTLRKDSLPDYADNFPELVRIVRNAGVDGIFTDHSDQTRQAIKPSNNGPAGFLIFAPCDPKSDPGCD